MNKDPRHIALNVLLYWHKDSNTLDYALKNYDKEILSLPLKDKKFCNALIFGVLRQRESIDWIIDEFSNIPLNKITINLLYILRIALFQIIYMDRVPLFASINTSVDIAKKLAGKKKAGYINAVLRKASADYKNFALPDFKKNPSKFIAVKYSLPLWLSRKWIRSFGFDKTCKLCCQINEIPAITIRTNTLKTDRQTLFSKLLLKVKTIEKTNFVPEGISFTSPDAAINEIEEFKQGLFQVQDEAAQIITHFLSPRPGEKILDACAGFGGKTGHIAQIMKNSGIIIAADTGSQKLESLDMDMQKLGIDIVETQTINILNSSIKDFEFYFDRVLIDAPCTGLGVLRRNPDTKWKRSKNDIARLGAKQKKMLNCAANLVKPGGILVYAVCSCEKEENEDVIDKFLTKRKDFSIDKDFKYDRFEQLITRKEYLKTYPDINNMDGFFAARLKRRKT
ncbi:MAG: 16S rRNA (cytosine(967)-C(5))-methyltransferase RsmB [Desulfobacula sp.]|nr:16S rRNA (cytosine(967)-C(5))-methyltransferase RsmB [Desulfobacula sp.]